MTYEVNYMGMKYSAGAFIERVVKLQFDKMPPKALVFRALDMLKKEVDNIPDKEWKKLGHKSKEKE